MFCGVGKIGWNITHGSPFIGTFMNLDGGPGIRPPLKV
ncbi:hypothetical protein ARZXY2_2306 [Arthrobacter sp. ZXY-2]|nr:hypothetical protein ARZXY2_2306 [Arthrobacter sp. ZXY-2]